MSKKNKTGSILGTLIAVGVLAGVLKYLNDYSEVRFTDDDQINSAKEKSKDVTEAAKRTYVALKNKGDVKSAAGEFAQAAGEFAGSAAEIAKTAGHNAASAAKDIKTKYDEDPSAVKGEFIDNLKDMGGNIAKKAGETFESVKDKFRDDGLDDIFEDIENKAEEAAAPEECTKEEEGFGEDAERIFTASDSPDAVKTDGTRDQADAPVETDFNEFK